jgi:hypothetical protein
MNYPLPGFPAGEGEYHPAWRDKKRGINLIKIKIQQMKPSHIEHIGIAVSNLEAAIGIYERIFDLSCYKIEDVPDQKVRTAFFMVGETKIELLESRNSPSGFCSERHRRTA